MTFAGFDPSVARGAARRPASPLTVALRAASTLALGLAVPLAACGSDDDGPDGPAAGGAAGAPSGGSANAGSANAGSESGGNASGGNASGGNAGDGSAGDGSASGGTAGAPATGIGPCNAVTVESPPTSALHVTQCSDITYSTNPPSGGQHYAVWAAFQSYDFPVPAGYLVHDLEHGAVVFWYNCPEGCADEVADVQALIDALPVDPLCAGTGVDRRAILVPYPELATRWGVSAWGHALTADCVDAELFTDFYTEHYAQGPEQLCNAGQAYTTDPCE